MAEQKLSPPCARPKTEFSGKSVPPNAQPSTRVFPVETSIQKHSFTTCANWLNVDRAAIVRDRLASLSLTEVAKKHRVSRATVCRLVNESQRLKRTGVLRVDNQETVTQSWITPADSSAKRRRP